MSEKILIADDEEIVRRLLVEIIGQMGFKCLQAKDGQEALELLKEKNLLRLLILDINMPKIDGLALLKKIRECYHYKNFYIMMMTGDYNNYYLDMILQSGGNDLIYKPLELSSFIQKIGCLLESM